MCRARTRLPFFTTMGSVKYWGVRQVRHKPSRLGTLSVCSCASEWEGCLLWSPDWQQKLAFLPSFLTPTLTFGECMGSVLPAAAFVYRPLHLTSISGWSLTYREPRLSQGIPFEDFDNHALHSLTNMAGIPVFAGFPGTVPLSRLCLSQYKVFLKSPPHHKWLFLAQRLAQGGV